ncbi:lysophospholipid acyltransferase family protein [Salinimicrobium oceani]|uniref:Lipid A biosynthesis acyltransferase n=1 Tax=Salinimicrobium oceani TaxID=2722702 RepID=A0ABX1D2C0_9FLAO|nr:lysophospholipid acyltransferase family protein [Salinimicrobium oceani]NJW53477.1 lipid A biosynthesis acyltransferase [Salinimicrobium oceani]
MQRLAFLLVYPILRLISLLPFRLFYLFSDVVFFVVYHISGYRKKIVWENLKLVFPEKSDAEIAIIRKAFYQHMVDMFLEMIKSISISNEELKKRFTFTNIEEIQKIRDMDKSILLSCGHYASYEWMNALQLYNLDYRGFGIYKKIKNPFFDKLAKDIRGRYDGVLIPTTEATKTISANERAGIKGVYAMIADQSPKLNRTKAWIDFMGITVPVFTGIENLSRTLDMAVVYLHVEKTKRGYYQASFKTLSYDPANEPPYRIIREYFEELEQQIIKAPQYYLWTHKRWKHKDISIPENAVVIRRD